MEQWYSNVGITHMATGNYKKAIQLFEEARRLGLSGSESCMNTGYCFFCLKDYHNAIAWYKRALQESDQELKYGNTAYWIGRSYHHLRDFDQAIEWLQKAADQNDEDAKKMIRNISKK